MSCTSGSITNKMTEETSEEVMDLGTGIEPRRFKYLVNLLLNWEAEDEDASTAIQFCNHFVQQFESEAHSFFYPYRDQVGGATYMKVLGDAVEQSQYTVVILTRGFLKDSWLRYSQQVALKHCLESDQGRLIPVTVGLKKSEVPKELSALTVIQFDKDFLSNIIQWKRLERSIFDRSDCPGVKGHRLPHIGHYGPSSFNELPKIRSALDNVYISEKKCIRLIPWDEEDSIDLDKVYTKLSISRETSEGISVTEDILDHYTDVFDLLDDDRVPTRIRVEGDAGTGKTTLVLKMAVDWAESNADEQVMQQFKLVLLILLSDISPGMKLEDAVLDQLLPKDLKVSPQNLRHLIEESEENILILLDGYDEYMNCSEDINDIIRNKRLRLSTVVLTTRPTKLPQGHWDKKCRIKGFNKEDQRKYIHCLLVGHSSAIKTLEEKLDCDDIPHDLCSVPLLLCFLCLLAEEEGNIPDSLTGIYKEVLQFMYQRHNAKHQNPLSMDKDNLIFAIGQFAWESLKNDQLGLTGKQRTSHGLAQDAAVALGILCPQRRLGRLLQCKRQYIFLHKTMQEFCAASFLAGKAHGTERLKELIDVCNDWERLKQFSYVIRFYLGLCSNDLLINKALEHIDIIARKYICDAVVKMECNVAKWESVWVTMVQMVRDISVKGYMLHNTLSGSVSLSQYQGLVEILNKTSYTLCPEIVVSNKNSIPTVSMQKMKSHTLQFCILKVNSLCDSLPWWLSAKNLQHLILNHVALEGKLLPHVQVMTCGKGGNSTSPEDTVDVSSPDPDKQQSDDIRVTDVNNMVLHYMDTCPPTPCLRSLVLHMCTDHGTPNCSTVYLLRCFLRSISSLETLVLWFTKFPADLMADYIEKLNPTSNLKTFCYSPKSLGPETDRVAKVLLNWCLGGMDLDTLVLYNTVSMVQILPQITRPPAQCVRYLTLLYIEGTYQDQDAYFSWISSLSSLRRLVLHWFKVCPQLENIFAKSTFPNVTHLVVFLDNLCPVQVKALGNMALPGESQLKTLELVMLKDPTEAVGEAVSEIIANILFARNRLEVKVCSALSKFIPPGHKGESTVTLSDFKLFGDVNHVISRAALTPILESTD